LPYGNLFKRVIRVHLIPENIVEFVYNNIRAVICFQISDQLIVKLNSVLHPHKPITLAFKSDFTIFNPLPDHFSKSSGGLRPGFSSSKQSENQSKISQVVTVYRRWDIFTQLIKFNNIPTAFICVTDCFFQAIRIKFFASFFSNIFNHFLVLMNHISDIFIC